jgi:hypothetical protein
MRRWRWKAVFGLGAIILILALCWPRAEPAYLGRPLSFWLQGFESDTMEARSQSAEAVRRIGTNALPPLIVLLHKPASRQEPLWRQWLRALLGKQSLVKIHVPRPPDVRTSALAALYALGPLAKDAAPALENLLHENPPDQRALIVLAGIGPEGIPPLTRALTNDEKVIRLGARVCLKTPQTRSTSPSPQAAEDAEFMRRTCEFNAGVLRAALEDYRAQHPGEFSPDGMPRPTLPPDFTPQDIPETDRAQPNSPPTPPGYE